MFKCFECGKEVETDYYYAQGELILCNNCTENYAYCRECGKFLPVDDLNEDYLCEKCAPYYEEN